MNILHILYNTNDVFEKYLTGRDIMIMRHVSNLCHNGPITMIFIEDMKHLIDEHRIFMRNNQTLNTRHLINEFLFLVPLRAIFNNKDMYVVELLVDYLYDINRLSYITYTCIGLEFGRDTEFKNNITYMEDVCIHEKYEVNNTLGSYFSFIDYSMHYVYLDMVEQACIRDRPEIVEYIFQRPECRELYCDEYRYYGITKELRDIFIKYNEYYIEFLKEEVGPYQPDMFALIETNCKDNIPLNTTLIYSLRCNDKKRIEEYMNDGEVNISYNTDLKYTCYGYILHNDQLE